MLKQLVTFQICYHQKFYTREAIHTGNLAFGQQSGDVYYSMLDVFMRSERETVEFLLERYPVS